MVTRSTTNRDCCFYTERVQHWDFVATLTYVQQNIELTYPQLVVYIYELLSNAVWWKEGRRDRRCDIASGSIIMVTGWLYLILYAIFRFLWIKTKCFVGCTKRHVYVYITLCAMRWQHLNATTAEQIRF